MTNAILVPLDGSPLAESALSEAAVLARALEATVILLSVVTPRDDVIRSGTMRISVDEIFTAERDRALKYLEDVAARPMWAGLTTQIVVEAGNAAETIVDFARAHGVDRIVMATHGRSGLTRWVFGSVAEKVLHAADRTVVLVRASAPSAQSAP